MPRYDTGLLSRYALSAIGLVLTACGTAQPLLRAAATDEARTERASAYTSGSHRPSRAFEIVLVSGKARDCDAEHNQCFDDCWNSPPPETHIERGKAGHYKYCTSLCLKKYMECCKQQELRPRAFPEMKAALEWLKQHKTEVLVGSVVVVAGVAFIVSTGGAGALILLPLAAI